MGGLDGKVVEIMKSYVNWEKLAESQSLRVWNGPGRCKILVQIKFRYYAVYTAAYKPASRHEIWTPNADRMHN